MALENTYRRNSRNLYKPERRTARKRTPFAKDVRLKLHHWHVTPYDADGERFSRTYANHEKVDKFVGRQRKSPVVRMARVVQVS